MAPRTRTGTPTPNYGRITIAILYGIVTVVAIWLGIYSNAEYALKAHLVCAVIASILLAFLLPKGTTYDDTKQKAAYVFMHLVLWGCIIFLPFGTYPELSLAAIMLLGIAESAYISAMTKPENDARTAESRLSIAGTAKSLFWVIVAVIAIYFIATQTEYGKKAVIWGKGFINSIESSKKNSAESGSSQNENSDKNQGPRMTASFKQWSDPLVLKIDHLFSTTATGIIDLNKSGNDAVNLIINLPKSGNIILDNGTVASINGAGGSILGNWKQDRTGLTGNYTIVVYNSTARLVLKHSGYNIAVIEIK